MMKKKNRLRTNNLRTIKNFFPRFLSLTIMSLLGVLVYVGLSSTSPDMIYTLDRYLDDYNTYDLKIVSSMGLDDNDINAIKNIENVTQVEGVHSKDVLIKKDDNEYVLSITSLPEKINTIELIEGRLPSESSEIVVEKNLLDKVGYKIGDKIVVQDDSFISKEMEIVGVVRSSLYYSNTKVQQNRGTTTIGTGTINYYSYVLNSNFNQDYYMSIYLTINNAKEEVTSSKKYDELIDDVLNKLDGIRDSQENIRYETLYNTAYKEIEDKENKLNSELDKAKKDLNDAKIKLTSAKNTLDNTKKDLDNAKKELDIAKKELYNGTVELEKILKSNNISNISDAIISVNSSINELTKELNKVDKNSTSYIQVYNNLTSLKKKQAMLKQLSDSKNKLDNSRVVYNNGLVKYNEGYKKYQGGLKQYNNSLKKYEDGLGEYNSNKEKYGKEIEEAKEQVLSMEKPKWFIYNRYDDQTYSSYIDQTQSIKSLAGLFPLVFFAVAILVSLVSMNRMVEDDRIEIGTLKSLGFSNFDIQKKYLTFSFSATLLGSAIGCVIGLTFIPYLIFSIYKLLFDVPDFQFTFDIISICVGIITAVVCICGASTITAKKVLRYKPSELMRPKVPKAGKKIFLEKFKWMWRRISFSNKITIRNIFMYKKRVLITIIGICGCTALMLCGFGIKDSIIDITNMQYVTTFNYDATVYANNLNEEDLSIISSNSQIIDYTLSQTITGTLNESNISVIVTDGNNIEKIINLVDEETNEKLELKGDDVIITDKIADIYKIKEGDSIKFLDSYKKEYTFKVTNIVKNYIGHYLYVSSSVFENNNFKYEPNVIYLNTKELSENEQDKLANELLDNDNFINIVNTRMLVNSVQDMLNSLNKVVIILVLLAAMLSFVVLYNLANINISERKREISTLKVLGFYDNEVDSYITKEMIISTIIGIFLGLVLGYFLTNAVISTVEMENARFIRHIKLNSYLYASGISILFTLIINFVTHFVLKKIDMIESLKSVE